MSNSLSYQPFLISRLQDHSYAAGYIETCLTLNSPEPNLLKLVLSDVAQALAPQTMTLEDSQKHLAQLDDFLSQTDEKTIYNLANWLKSLGLKLSVNIDVSDKININSEINFLQQLLTDDNIEYSIRLKAAQNYHIKLEDEQSVLTLGELLTNHNIEYPIRLIIAGNCVIKLKAILAFRHLLADQNVEYPIRMRLAESLGNNSDVKTLAIGER